MFLKKNNPLNFIDFFMIFIGSAIYAFGFVSINIASKLAEGGIEGITLILKFLFQFNPAISMIVINVPIFIIGYRYLGKKSLIYNIYGTLMLAFWVWIWQVIPVKLNVNHDLFISAILAGIISGIGLGIVYRFNGTTGGTDIIAKILERKKGIAMGQSMFVLDVCVLLASLTYINLQRMMYAVVASYVFSRVANFIQNGGYSARGLIIITKKPKEISNDIINNLERGVTYLEMEGAFSEKKNRALYCVIGRNEITEIKRIIMKYDKHAFVSIIDVDEVMGEGFTFNIPSDNIEDIIKKLPKNR